SDPAGPDVHRRVGTRRHAVSQPIDPPAQRVRRTTDHAIGHTSTPCPIPTPAPKERARADPVGTGSLPGTGHCETPCPNPSTRLPSGFGPQSITPWDTRQRHVPSHLPSRETSAGWDAVAP